MNIHNTFGTVDSKNMNRQTSYKPFLKHIHGKIIVLFDHFVLLLI